MPTPIATSIYTRDNPYLAHVTESRLLSRRGSAKETRHFVVELAGSGIRYEPGDSLGVFPSNRPEDVEAIIARIGAGGDERVMLPRATEPISLREALNSRLSLAGPSRRIVETLAARASEPAEAAALAGLLAPQSREALAEWLRTRQFIDLLEEFPSARLGAQELVDHMFKLHPRLYSIASSQRVHPHEAFLMVSVVRYQSNGRDRVGVCSTYLGDRVTLGSTLTPVFLAHSSFGLPGDSSKDVIMIGPGTGVAPFRAFVEDRAASGATGRNWLFFGEQKRASDFAYEEEWSRWLAAGSLARLDTAFSRDQAAKVYVQDRMRENAAELWRWVNSGAFLYVCGDAKRMAKDVDAALHEVVAGAGGLTPAAAADYVKGMKREKRYLRDVY